MTAKEIQTYLSKGFDPTYFHLYVGAALWQIALQLALLNEHNARMEARYMELTAKAAGNQKEKVKRQKAKVSDIHHS